MMSQTPVEEFNSLLSSSSVLFVVFYRGHWCPFCRAYLTTLQELTPKITAVGGKTLTITSEPASFLAEMRASTGYTGASIVDPETTLAALVKERYALDVAISEKKGYEHGMMQPAILVLRGGKEGSVEVLEKWAIVPSTMNLGGASDRPDLTQVWENVEAKIEGKGTVYGKYKKQGILATLWGMLVGGK